MYQININPFEDASLAYDTFQALGPVLVSLTSFFEVFRSGQCIHVSESKFKGESKNEVQNTKLLQKIRQKIVLNMADLIKKMVILDKNEDFLIFFIKVKFVTYLNTNKGNNPQMEQVQVMCSYV